MEANISFLDKISVLANIRELPIYYLAVNNSAGGNWGGGYCYYTVAFKKLKGNYQKFWKMSFYVE